MYNFKRPEVKLGEMSKCYTGNVLEQTQPSISVLRQRHDRV